MSDYYDIVVVGAGPAGASCAMALKDNLRCAVIDKATFPRDKVCGDAIPGRAIRVMEEISPDLISDFTRFSEKQLIRTGRAVAPSGAMLDLHFQRHGYCASRMEFDAFLYDKAREMTGADFFSGDALKDIQRDEAGLLLQLKSGKHLRAAMVVACDGAQSVVAKKLADKKVDKDNYSGAVRAYMKNVKGVPEDTMAIYFLKDYLPGYFWIFPLKGNYYNVGFGMMSKDIAARKLNLKAALKDICDSDELRGNFSEASFEGDIRGYNLPMGGRKQSISGERYMLCGDAASLIDPATGEGIGNAMLSGRLAALQLMDCFDQKRFDAGFMKQYDDAVYRALWKELRNKKLVQQSIGHSPVLLNQLITAASKYGWLKKIVSKVF